MPGVDDQRRRRRRRGHSSPTAVTPPYGTSRRRLSDPDPFHDPQYHHRWDRDGWRPDPPRRPSRINYDGGRRWQDARDRPLFEPALRPPRPYAAFLRGPPTPLDWHEDETHRHSVKQRVWNDDDDDDNDRYYDDRHFAESDPSPTRTSRTGRSFDHDDDDPSSIFSGAVTRSSSDSHDFDSGNYDDDDGDSIRAQPVPAVRPRARAPAKQQQQQQQRRVPAPPARTPERPASPAPGPPPQSPSSSFSIAMESEVNPFPVATGADDNEVALDALLGIADMLEKLWMGASVLFAVIALVIVVVMFAMASSASYYWSLGFAAFVYVAVGVLIVREIRLIQRHLQLLHDTHHTTDHQRIRTVDLQAIVRSNAVAGARLLKGAIQKGAAGLAVYGLLLLIIAFVPAVQVGILVVALFTFAVALGFFVVSIRQSRALVDRTNRLLGDDDTVDEHIAP